MAYVYFSNKDDAEFCLKYLHLRFVENKQIFASFANNYLDITDFRTRIELGIKIEDKQLEIKYFLRQIGMNFKLLEGLEKIALIASKEKNENKLQKVNLLLSSIKEKNDYLKYRYRLLNYEYNQINNLAIDVDKNKLNDKQGIKKIL
jgi:hypothetical protein